MDDDLAPTPDEWGDDGDTITDAERTNDAIDAGIERAVQEKIYDQQHRMADEVYNEASFVWKGRMVESDFKAYVENELNPNVISTTTLFSLSCKLALLRIVNSFFDKNTPLSNMPNVERPMLLFEMELNKSIIAMHSYDVNNPQLLVAFGTLRDAYYKLVTRAVGGVENKRQYTSQSDVTISTPRGNNTQVRQVKKRGWGAILGGGDGQ